jgi:threonine synthase
MSNTKSTLTHLECGLCGTKYAADQLINLCRECGKPLLARYDLDRARQTLTKASMAQREPSLWRYEEVLPVKNDWAMLKLGEGWTPLHHARRLGAVIGCEGTYIKDEGLNVTA